MHADVIYSVPARSFYPAERLTLEGLRPELQTVIDPAYVSEKIRAAMRIVEDWRSRPTHGPPNKVIIYVSTSTCLPGGRRCVLFTYMLRLLELV